MPMRVSRVHDMITQAESKASSRHLCLKFVSSHLQFMGRIVKKVALFLRYFHYVYCLKCGRPHSVNRTFPPPVHKHPLHPLSVWPHKWMALYVELPGNRQKSLPVSWLVHYSSNHNSELVFTASSVADSV